MKLSPTMQQAVDFAKANGGKLIRHAGGYWSSADWGLTSTGHIQSFGTTTAHALVTRGVAEYCEWRTNASGRFPIELRIKAGG
jgi:hypothetical protein